LKNADSFEVAGCACGNGILRIFDEYEELFSVGEEESFRHAFLCNAPWGRAMLKLHNLAFLGIFSAKLSLIYDCLIKRTDVCVADW
jgi:hypothetical protein